MIAQPSIWRPELWLPEWMMATPGKRQSLASGKRTAKASGKNIPYVTGDEACCCEDGIPPDCGCEDITGFTVVISGTTSCACADHNEEIDNIDGTYNLGAPGLDCAVLVDSGKQWRQYTFGCAGGVTASQPVIVAVNLVFGQWTVVVAPGGFQFANSISDACIVGFTASNSASNCAGAALAHSGSATVTFHY